MADTLFAVSFAIGEGGDGCSASGMSRISADARRLFDVGPSSLFGLTMRNQGVCFAQYDPTGRGAQPSGGPITKREIWERVFIRLRKFPTSGSPDPVVWALSGTIEGSPALCLRVNGSGVLTLYNQGNASAPGTALSSSSVGLNIWCRFEIFVRFNNSPATPPSPPYENNGFVSWRIDGLTVSNHDRTGLIPQFGVDRFNQQAIQSQLGDAANTGKGLEIDYADWIADGSEWVDGHRRVTLLRPTGAGTHTDWAGDNPDYRHQLDCPFVGGGLALGVSTSTGNASQSYAIETAASKGISGPIHSARIAVFFAAVGGANINLILRHNGSESLHNIGTPPQGFWSSWRVSTSGWDPGDTLEIGVKSSSGTTRIGACALLVEHESVGPSVADQDGAVRVLQTTYTGNGTQQSIDLGALDADVASLIASFVLVIPESGTSPGAWWWDSKVFASDCNNASAASFEVIAAPGKVHVTGSAASSNQNLITYRLIACFDPRQRVIARGAVSLPGSADNRNVTLRDAGFTPEAVIIVREAAPSNDSTKIYYRGAGHSGDQSVSLGVDVNLVADAVQSVQAGGFQVGTLINESAQDFGFIACRTAPFTSPRLIAITSYTGNGSNPRAISLSLDGGTPIFALVVPTNSGKRWMRYGSVAKQFNGSTGGGANAITAFGADSLTVGSELNANAVTYSVLALAAGADDLPVLKYCSFDSGWQLEKDDGTGAYDEPQWQDSPSREYPYLIKESSTLRIKKAQVLIPSHVSGATYLIRGTGPGGINIPSTTAFLVSGDLFEITSVDATASMPSGATNFYNTFDILWEVSRDSGTSWQTAGISKTPLYVCLSATGPLAVTLYRTVVHLACSNIGATDRDEAVARTWALFSGLNVATWDQVPLYYYRPGTDFDANLITVAALLQNRTGQCVTFAHLLQDAWTVNGVSVNSNSPGSSYYTTATCTLGLGSFFWVKTWTNTAHDWFYFESTEFDMRPEPPDLTYGHYDNGGGVLFKNEATLPGQNTAPDAPSEKVFANHQFVKYTNLSSAVTYYDPSYVATYTDAADFQSQALAGFGITAQLYPNPLNPQKLRLDFNPIGVSTIVSFDH